MMSQGIYIGLGVSVVLFAYALLGRNLAKRCRTERFPGTDDTNSSPGVPHILVVLAIALVALGLRAHQIDRGLSYDELVTAYHFIDERTLWEAISTNYVFNNHVGYSVAGQLALLVFPQGDVAIRMPALLMGLAGIAYLFFFARRLMGTAVATIATAALAVSPAHVLWSGSARGYTGLVLFTLVASDLYLRLLRRPDRTNMGVFILASAIGIVMHLYAAWITLVQFTFLVSLAVLAGRSQVARLSVKSFNQLWLAFAIIGLLSLVCYTPLFSSFESTIHVRGRTPVELLFPFTVFLAFVGPDAGSATVITLAFLIPGVIAFSQRHRLEMVYFTALLLVPLLAMWLVIRPFDLYARFFVYWLPYFTLLLATGICSAGTWLSNFHKGVAPKVACWAMAGVLAWTWVGQGWRIMPQAPFRQAVTWLSQGAGATSTLCGFGPDVVMLNYYASAKIHVMTSTLQLNHVIDTADDLRCAFHDVRWASDLSRAMAATMAEILSSRRFRRVVVYGPGRLDAPRATE